MSALPYRPVPPISTIQSVKTRVAEGQAVAAIPGWLMERMVTAQAEHVAKGGCPGCGSQIQAVHTAGCRTNANDLY